MTTLHGFFRTMPSCTAVIRIRIRVNAIAVASDQPAAAILHTLAAITHLPVVTRLPAGTAVTKCRLQIKALPVTLCLPRRTKRLACALTAYLTACTRVPAFTTVFLVGIQTGTDLPTHGLAGRAHDTARAIHTEKPCITRVATSATICRICFQIRTDLRLTRLIRRITDVLTNHLPFQTLRMTCPVLTRHATPAYRATCATVPSIRLQIRALRLTVFKPSLTDQRTNALHTRLAPRTHRTAGSAIERIRHQIRTSFPAQSNAFGIANRNRHRTSPVHASLPLRALRIIANGRQLDTFPRNTGQACVTYMSTCTTIPTVVPDIPTHAIAGHPCPLTDIHSLQTHAIFTCLPLLTRRLTRL